MLVNFLIPLERKKKFKMKIDKHAKNKKQRDRAQKKKHERDTLLLLFCVSCHRTIEQSQ